MICNSDWTILVRGHKFEHGPNGTPTTSFPDFYALIASIYRRGWLEHGP